MGRGEHQSLVLRSEGDIQQTLETWPSTLGKAPTERGFSAIKISKGYPPVPRESVSPRTPLPSPSAQRPRRSSTPTRALNGGVQVCHPGGLSQPERPPPSLPSSKGLPVAQTRPVTWTSQRYWSAEGCALPTRSSPSVRCSPRRRSPTARSLTHSPPSRLTSRVWKRLQRRSRWSGPPQTAPPHGSTDAGDEADDEADAAGSGGGEATQRHNTLLIIGREARATGRRGERGRHAGVLGRLARALRCRQAGGMGSFREPRPAARSLDGHAPGETLANHRPEQPLEGRSHP